MGAAHSAERIQAVRRLAGEGMSDREIGGQLGLSKAAVEKIRRNHSIPPGKVVSVAPDVLKVIRSMAADGAADAEIGRAVGMSKAAVWGVRKRHNIQKDAVRYSTSGASPKVIKQREYHVHGTPSMYNSGCRCDDCRACQRERAQMRKAHVKELVEAGEAKFTHGRSGYINWGCRCDVCRQAGSRANKEYYQNGPKRQREKGAAGREAHREQMREKSQAWRDENREHVRAANNQRFRDYQRETVDQAKKHYQQWTSAELEVISRTDISVKEMAHVLGRTWNAVQKQRQKMRDAERGKKPQTRTSTTPGAHAHGLGGYGRGCRCDTCAEAKRQYRQEHEKKVKSATVPGARNAGKEWTGPELEMAARHDLSVTEIARRLGRSYAAVSVVRHKIRYDPKTINFAGIARGMDEPVDNNTHGLEPEQ